MKKILSRLWQHRTYERAYQEALNCAKNGDKSRSFEIFNSLLEEHPFDVKVRRQILLLANDLGKDVNLLDENVMNLKQ
jgi:hypothetical protein